MSMLQTVIPIIVIYSTIIAIVFSVLAIYSTAFTIYSTQDISANYPSTFAKRTNQPCNPNFAKKLVQFSRVLAIFTNCFRWHSVSVRHSNLLLVIGCFCYLFFQTLQGAQVITAPKTYAGRSTSICNKCRCAKDIHFALQMRRNILSLLLIFG